VPYHAHAFVDGGYTTQLARESNVGLCDPHALSHGVFSDAGSWGRVSHQTFPSLTRVTFYDAVSDDPSSSGPPPLQEYWEQIELLPDTSLGFGSLRGRRSRQPRQKGVDTLIAVDMLVGAFTNIFALAILISGDADFVPVAEELHRRGIGVVVAAHEKSLAEDLKRAADRFVAIGPGSKIGWPPMKRRDGNVWT
jgi:uncharacterized LabA/DUF88 family protein